MGVISRETVSVSCGAPFSGKFKAELDLRGDGFINHVLTIILKVNLIRVSMVDTWPKPIPPEFEKYRWENGEWAEFTRKFVECGSIWHRRFCLVPPNAATYFDVGVPIIGNKFMPNVECHFKVQIDDGTGRNWDVQILKASNLGSKSAETSALSGASMEDNATTPSSREMGGQTFIQTAVGHEIGHMLGQPHAGALKHSPNCMRAIKEDITEKIADDPSSRYRLNSHNATACYGVYDGKAIPGVADNIMGLGQTMAAENAISWQKALEELAPEAKVPGWKVEVQGFVPPRRL